MWNWRRKWLPTPVFLPGKSHGQRSLVGYSPLGCKSRMQLSTWSCIAPVLMSGVATIETGVLCSSSWYSLHPTCNQIPGFIDFSSMPCLTRLYVIQPLASFPAAAQISPAPTFLLCFSCSDFRRFSNLSSSLLTQDPCTCFAIYLELFPQIFIWISASFPFAVQV